MGKFPPQLSKRVSGGGLKEKLRIAKEGGELEFSRIQSHLKARMVARDGRRKLRKSHDDPLRMYLVRAIGAPDASRFADFCGNPGFFILQYAIVDCEDVLR